MVNKILSSYRSSFLGFYNLICSCCKLSVIPATDISTWSSAAAPPTPPPPTPTTMNCQQGLYTPFVTYWSHMLWTFQNAWIFQKMLPLKDYNCLFVDTSMMCYFMTMWTILVALTVLKAFICDCYYVLYMLHCTSLRNWIRVVGTATRLQAGGFKVWIPVGARHTSLPQNVQTGSGTHPTSYSMGTRIPSQG